MGFFSVVIRVVVINMFDFVQEITAKCAELAEAELSAPVVFAGIALVAVIALFRRLQYESQELEQQYASSHSCKFSPAPIAQARPILPTQQLAGPTGNLAAPLMACRNNNKKEKRQRNDTYAKRFRAPTRGGRGMGMTKRSMSLQEKRQLCKDAEQVFSEAI